MRKEIAVMKEEKEEKEKKPVFKSKNDVNEVLKRVLVRAGFTLEKLEHSTDYQDPWVVNLRVRYNDEK